MMPIYPSLYSNMFCFIAYAVMTAFVYRLLPFRWRQQLLLVANAVFYGLCCGWYIVVMLIVAGWTYFCAKQIQQSPHHKRWLTAGIVPTVASLAAFKYAAPLSSILSSLLSADVCQSIARLLIPLGISYYALKAISYLYDIYKEKYPAANNGWQYFAYLTFFGQIIAGPIQRFDQWRQASVQAPRHSDWHVAFSLLLRGLFLKLVIAHRIAPYITVTLSQVESTEGLNLWFFFVFYAFYIYADFAGYSYIAIGVTRMFGIYCPDNFSLPYFSANVREFWSRWHISLSSWLRDYIYIPLGGNRKGNGRRVTNLLAAFAVSGLWHGSTLNFLLWGLYHGMLNAMSPKRPSAQHFSLHEMGCSFGTFLLVSVGWIIFATPDLQTATDIFWGMMTRTTLSVASIQAAILPFTLDNTCLSYFLVLMLLTGIYMIAEFIQRYKLMHSNPRLSFIWHVFLLTSLLLFGQLGNVSFIYAGF